MQETQSKPLQKRALLTREKILDGLEALLSDQEFEAISIAQIARKAGVAVGSVYSHYKDKDALLPALLDRQLQRVEARLAELKATGTLDGLDLSGSGRPDLKTLIRFSVENALKQIDSSLGVRRALFTYRRLNPGLEIPLAKTLADQAFESLVAQLDDYRGEIQRDDLRNAAKMINYFVNILFLDRIVFVNSPFQNALRPDDETLIQTYTDMVYHYLTGA
ncbi:MAG: TetR/AcrR family transcriptional regulator [Pseudomonadota bacterium]